MENHHFKRKLPKPSKGYFWTGVGCIVLSALLLLFIIVILILDPTITMGLFALGFGIIGVGLIWLGMFSIDVSKSGYITYLGEGVDLSKEKLFGIVRVSEMRSVGFSTGWVDRDLRFYSTGIWSPDPKRVRVRTGTGGEINEEYRSFEAKSYTIPYADITKIRVGKRYGLIPCIQICIDLGSKHTFHLEGRRADLQNCCNIVNKACPDKLDTKYKYLKGAPPLKPDKVKYGERLTQGRISDLENLKGKLASTSSSRLALYHSGLRTLIEEGGSSVIIFECEGKPECYVQFLAWPDTPQLVGEVSSEPVSERGHGVLLSRGFEAPDESNPNYSQIFEDPEPRNLADLTETIFRDALECPDSFTAHVAEAAYEQ